MDRGDDDEVHGFAPVAPVAPFTGGGETDSDDDDGAERLMESLLETDTDQGAWKDFDTPAGKMTKGQQEVELKRIRKEEEEEEEDDEMGRLTESESALPGAAASASVWDKFDTPAEKVTKEQQVVELKRIRKEEEEEDDDDDDDETRRLMQSESAPPDAEPPAGVRDKFSDSSARAMTKEQQVVEMMKTRKEEDAEFTVPVSPQKHSGGGRPYTPRRTDINPLEAQVLDRAITPRELTPRLRTPQKVKISREPQAEESSSPSAAKNVFGRFKSAAVRALSLNRITSRVEEKMPELSQESQFNIHWNPKELADRTCKALRVDCQDPMEAVVNALDLDGWFKQNHGFHDGLQGVIQIIGNSNQLEKSLTFARQVAKLKEENPDLEWESLLAMRNELYPEDESTSGIGLAMEIPPDEAESRLRMMFSRGVVHAARNVHAAIFTSGFDRGPVAFAGRASRDRGHVVPLIGVAPFGYSTYPGDKRPGADERIKLEPNHTHLVGVNSNDVYDAVIYRFKLTDALVQGGNRKGKQKGKTLPVCAVLCNGADAALDETLQCSRKGWPIVVVKGSGGAADAVAWVCNPLNRSFFIPNPVLMEIAREAKVEIIDLENVDGKMTQAMLERLFDTLLRKEGGGSPADGGGAGAANSENLSLAWKQVVLYRSNAKLSERKEFIIQFVIAVLSVVLITMVAVKTYFLAENIHNQAMDIILNLPLLFLPIFISVCVAIASRLQFDLKGKILRAGAELLLSEIYRYRTKTGLYAEKGDSRLGIALQKVVEMVTGTIVGEMSLSRHALEEIDAGCEFAVSAFDDGFSNLSSEKYLKLRIDANMERSNTQSIFYSNFYFNARLLTFIFGACGTILAGADMNIFVAVATAFAVAIQSAVEKSSPLTKLKALNRCIGELGDAKAWWKSLTKIEQANPLKFSELVRITETSLMTMLQSTNAAATGLTIEDGYTTELDINGFISDVMQNIEDGKIVFQQHWMDKYHMFFDRYHEWYSTINNLQLKGTGPDHKPLMDDVGKLPTTVKVEDEPLSVHVLEEILWDPEEFSLRTSRVVHVAQPIHTSSVKEIGKMLDISNWIIENSNNPLPSQGLSAVRGVVTVIGSSATLDEYLVKGEDQMGFKLPDRLSGEESMARLRMVFSRGIIASAHQAGAVVLTSGLDVGPPAYTGYACRDRLYQVPVIGIASKSKVSWPGDERPGQLDRVALNPDHTHFVLLPSDDEYSANNFRFKLANYYSNNGELPSIAFVVNGGIKALESLLSCVRLGWPVVVIKGSGGLADRLAEGRTDPARYITDPMLTEILQEGHLEFIEMTEVDGGLCQQMMERIFAGGGDRMEDHDSNASENADDLLVSLTKMADAVGHPRGHGTYHGEPSKLSRQVPNLVMAWERHTKYKHNAFLSKGIAYWLAMSIVVLQMSSTVLAAIFEFTKKIKREEWKGVDSDEAELALAYMLWFLKLLPIFVSLMVAVENEARQGLKAALLKSGAEVVLSHIYQYRTGVGDYASAHKASSLAMMLKEEDERLVSSGVNEMGLSQAGVIAEKISAFRISAEDDAFSELTPEDYVTLRLHVLVHYYEQQTVLCARGNMAMTLCIYILGGLGTAIALVPDAQVFVAITTALSSALVNLMDTLKYQEKVFVYNRCISELTTVLTWWRSLSSISKANPQKFTQLVQEVEAVKERELRALFPAAFKASNDKLAGAPPFNPTLFKQDLMDNIDSHGNVQFKRTWVERHEKFFLDYQGWMYSQDMWEAIPPDQPVEQRPPIADQINDAFLQSSIINLKPVVRGRELLEKWVSFWNEGERTVQEWWEEGPKEIRPVGDTRAV